MKRKKITLLLTSDVTDEACANYIRGSLCSAEILRRWLVMGYLCWDNKTVRSLSKDIKDKVLVSYSHYGKEGEDAQVSSIFRHIDSIQSNSQRLNTIRHLILLGYEFENGLLGTGLLNTTNVEQKAVDVVSDDIPVIPDKLKNAQNSLKGLMDV